MHYRSSAHSDTSPAAKRLSADASAHSSSVVQTASTPASLHSCTVEPQNPAPRPLSGSAPAEYPDPHPAPRCTPGSLRSPSETSSEYRRSTPAHVPVGKTDSPHSCSAPASPSSQPRSPSSASPACTPAAPQYSSASQQTAPAPKAGSQSSHIAPCCS